jgi:phosphoribosylformylglycinamidine cyclo-ligase
MPESDKQIQGPYTYRDSGVDINKANSLLSGLKSIISSTHSGAVLSDLSSFSGLFRPEISGYKDPVLASTTDGVGTKLILARQIGDYSGVGQDLVAMNINDLICCGAKPLFFLDYIACGKIDESKIESIIRSIADACRYCDTALIGGETAEMPGMYADEDIDLAGFALGLVDRDKIPGPGSVSEGDLIAGLKSSGFHSNGFSLIRKIIDKNHIDIKMPLEWAGGKSLSELLLEPTRLYAPLIKDIIEDDKIRTKGIANITGGGFYDNISRIIPDNMDAIIHKNSWDIPPVFNYIRRIGNISEEEMFHVFNMGIGMVLIISRRSLEKVKRAVSKKGDDIILLGEVAPGSGSVKIK